MPGVTSPCSEAYTTAWTRSRTPSLSSAWATWVLTVVSATSSALAISVLERPRTTRSRTSRSRAVSRASAAGSAVPSIGGGVDGTDGRRRRARCRSSSRRFDDPADGSAAAHQARLAGEALGDDHRDDGEAEHDQDDHVDLGELLPEPDGAEDP